MSAEEALRRALYALWAGDAAVGALIGNRIFDRVKKRSTFPYVEFGETQAIDIDADCHERFEVFQTIHVWSREVGNLEAMSITDALRKAVRAARKAKTFEAVGSGYQFPIIQHESTRVLDDPDGQTTHGVVTFQVVIDPQ